MPPVSRPQQKAMYAAAEGHSTLGIPASVGKEFIGEAVPKKKTRRGKSKPKPGGSHLAAMTKAHSAGDFAAARTHALNYAKSSLGLAPSTKTMSLASLATGDEADAGSTPMPDATVSQPVADPRRKLAMLAMKRRSV